MVSELEGYYVAALFSRDNEGNRILDLFNGHNENLFLSFVNELDTYVICTSARDVIDVCKRLNFSVTGDFKFSDGNFLRINPFTGEVMIKEKIKVGDRYKQITSYYSNGYYSDYYHGTNVVDATKQNSFTQRFNRKKLTKEHQRMLACVPNVRLVVGQEKEEILKSLMEG